jgi:hypothetical protein
VNEHQRCIELAAASIDFRLSADEQHALRTHLAICDSCSLTVRGIRDDATRLAAAPHPAAPATVRDTVIGAAARRSGRTSGLRWAVLATMLAAVLVAGSFVAGSVVDRLRGPQVPAPTLPTTVQRSTPAPSDQQALRPTATPAFASGWNDLGDISDAFGGRTAMSVMARPDGGLVAFGQDRGSATPVVWVSDDGVDWTEAKQQTEVFSNDVPTTGALGGPGMLVIGSAISVAGSQQRAIWESPDGRTWTESSDASAMLANNAADLTMAAGPAGVIVWRPSGQVWVSTDGATWKQGNMDVQGVTDVSVDTDGFVAVGRSGSNAFLVTSANGRDWGAPHREAAPAGTQVGIERSDDEVETVWIGDQRWQRSGSSWSAVQGATVPVPAPGSVVGGQADLVAMGSPTSSAYRAWTWDGSGDWVSAKQAAETGSAAPTVVAVAPHGSGWFVLTKRGSALHGWIVEP